MSAVHENIVEQAWRILPTDERELVRPFLEDLKLSSTYPDIFADRTMPKEAKAAIDPQADQFLWPLPPQTEEYQRILKMTETDNTFCAAPLRWYYLIEHYVQQILTCLEAEDPQSAVKHMGVYSHVIGDTGEPIHAVHCQTIDHAFPPPREHLGMELHFTVESLCAPVDVQDYHPVSLGHTRQQLVMNAYAGLVEVQRIGASQVMPIVQALYAGDKQKATALSSVAQSACARTFADFMHTIICLHRHGEKADDLKMDLCAYPFAHTDIDMLYRYRPMVDMSLIPFSNGQSVPLALPQDGLASGESVHGLGVLPFLGPPFNSEHHRQAQVQYYITPGAFQRFTARVGINPLFKHSIGSAVFSVQADHQEIFCSTALTGQDQPVAIDVPIGQAHWLTLTMHCQDNATFDDVQRIEKAGWALHGVWAEPCLST